MLLPTCAPVETLNPFWQAPELMQAKPIPCCGKTDVYSYGVVAWELFTKKRPFWEYDGKWKSLQQFKRMVLRGIRPGLPTVGRDKSHHAKPSDIGVINGAALLQSEIDSEKKFLALIQQCWEANPPS